MPARKNALVREPFKSKSFVVDVELDLDSKVLIQKGLTLNFDGEVYFRREYGEVFDELEHSDKGTSQGNRTEKTAAQDQRHPTRSDPDHSTISDEGFCPSPQGEVILTYGDERDAQERAKDRFTKPTEWDDSMDVCGPEAIALALKQEASQ